VKIEMGVKFPWDTDPRSALELFFDSTDDYDSYKQNNEFYALVVSNGAPVNEYLAALLNGNLGGRDFILEAADAINSPIPPNSEGEEVALNYFTNSKRFEGKYAFSGRLLGVNSPHEKLPMPCIDYLVEKHPFVAQTFAGGTMGVKFDPFEFDDFAARFNQSLVDMHTVFVTADCAGNTVPRIGDIYRVRLKPGRTENNTYRLDYGTALGRDGDLGKAGIKSWIDEGETASFKPYQAGCDTMLDLFREANPPYVPPSAPTPVETDSSLGKCKPGEGGAYKIAPAAAGYESNYIHTYVERFIETVPCSGYVVVSDTNHDEWSKLTKIFIKELDWWSCGNIMGAWGYRAADNSYGNMVKEYAALVDEEGFERYADRAKKCAKNLYLKNAKAGSKFSRPDVGPSGQGGGGGDAEAEMITKYAMATPYSAIMGAKYKDKAVTKAKMIKEGPAWSAMTVSWLMKQIDPEFPGSTVHYGYLLKAVGVKSSADAKKLAAALDKGEEITKNETLRKGYSVFPRNDRVMAQVGDVLVAPRGADGSTHGDVVVKIHEIKTGSKAGKYALLGGGNLSQTMRGGHRSNSNKGSVKLNSDGTYPSAASGANVLMGQAYTVVIKKNAVLKPKDDTAVAEIAKEQLTVV